MNPDEGSMRLLQRPHRNCRKSPHHTRTLEHRPSGRSSIGWNRPREESMSPEGKDRILPRGILYLPDNQRKSCIPPYEGLKRLQQRLRTGCHRFSHRTRTQEHKRNIRGRSEASLDTCPSRHNPPLFFHRSLPFHIGRCPCRGCRLKNVRT